MAASPLADRIQYAKALASSNLLPRAYQQQPANVLVAIEYGAALGLAPMVAIQSVHVVEGKPTASAQLIGSLVRRAGHRLRVTGDAKKAVAVITRSDDPDFEFRSEWTWERAAASGLTSKGVWKQYPDAMLKARAITEVARDACPEVLAGVAYTAEELGHETPAQPAPVSWSAEPVVVEQPAIETADVTVEIDGDVVDDSESTVELSTAESTVPESHPQVDSLDLARIKSLKRQKVEVEAHQYAKPRAASEKQITYILDMMNRASLPGNAPTLEALAKQLLGDQVPLHPNLGSRIDYLDSFTAKVLIDAMLKGGFK